MYLKIQRGVQKWGGWYDGGGGKCQNDTHKKGRERQKAVTTHALINNQTPQLSPPPPPPHTHTQSDPRHTTTPDMIHSAQTTLRPLRCHPMYPERGKSGPDLFAPLSRTATSTQRRGAQREGKSHVFLKGPAAELAPTEKGVKNGGENQRAMPGACHASLPACCQRCGAVDRVQRTRGRSSLFPDCLRLLLRRRSG